MFDPLVPHGWHRYWKSVELPPLTDGAIDTLIDHTSRITSPRSYTIILQLGGALGRVPEDATAFGQRDATHNVVINAVWIEGDPEGDRHIAWARDFFDAMQPHARDRVYVDFLGDEGPDRVRQAYGTEKYNRWSSSSTRTTDELLPSEPEHLAVARVPSVVITRSEGSARATKPKARRRAAQRRRKPPRSAQVRARRPSPKGSRDGRLVEAAGIEPASAVAPS